jgi:hypothetical protein
MTPNQEDGLGMTDPPEGKPPVKPDEALQNDEVDPSIIGPPVKIHPTDDNEIKTL